MGELSDTLDEFEEISREYYQKIMKILKEKYCWKCPMRSTSNETFCREIDAWIRLSESLEAGIRKELTLKSYSLENLEVMAARFLEKKMKSSKVPREKNIILKLEEDTEPFTISGDYLQVKINPRRVKVNDLVLLPRACPLATYWYTKTTKRATVPFKIFKVAKIFQKKGCRYIRTEESFEVPVEYVMGVVIKIMAQKDLSMQSWD
jgi:hypothetical protein